MQQVLSKKSSVQPKSRYKMSDNPDVLFEINNDDLNLCLWQRKQDHRTLSEVATFRPFQLRDRRIATTQKTFEKDIETIMIDQLVDPSLCCVLRADLQRLANIFFSVSLSSDTRFRLFTTIDDDCRRFHVDYQHLRMICTYQGPGTEWLTDDQANRAAYAAGAPNEDIIRFGAPSRFETSWVGFMKDDGFPGNRGGGFMHRSPSLAGSQDVRVVFCLESARL
jgi:hypothetical protein